MDFLLFQRQCAHVSYQDQVYKINMQNNCFSVHWTFPHPFCTLLLIKTLPVALLERERERNLWVSVWLPRKYEKGDNLTCNQHPLSLTFFLERKFRPGETIRSELGLRYIQDSSSNSNDFYRLPIKKSCRRIK